MKREEEIYPRRHNTDFELNQQQSDNNKTCFGGVYKIIILLIKVWKKRERETNLYRTIYKKREGKIYLRCHNTDTNHI